MAIKKDCKDCLYRKGRKCFLKECFLEEEFRQEKINSLKAVCKQMKSKKL